MKVKAAPGSKEARLNGCTCKQVKLFPLIEGEEKTTLGDPQIGYDINETCPMHSLDLLEDVDKLIGEWDN